MTKHLNSIREYCDSQNWNYSLDEEKNYLTMRMSLKAVDACTIHVQMRGDDGFTVYTVFPVKAPEGKRDAIAAFLTRANYGLILGNFEMDFDDGEIRFKVTVICGEQTLSPAVMERNFDMGFCMFDRYGEGLLKVLYGDAAPLDTVDAIERGDEEENGKNEAPAVPTAPGGTMLS